jgi:hypothetical protein
MKLTKRKALMILSALPLALVTAGCATQPLIVAQPLACAELIPERWHKPVEGAPLYDEDTADKADVIDFGIRQTNRLEEANGRTLDTIGIVETCQKWNADAAAKLKRKKFLGLF